MSLKVMTWAWELELPPTPKFVLMALADEANDRGFCYPSHRRIAQKCSINERSVRRMIGMLVAKGYVVVEQRFRNRARTSNGYQLTVDHPRTICPGGTGADAKGDRTQVPGGSGHPRPGAPDMDVRVTTTDPLVDPKPLPQPTRDAGPNAASPPVWDVFGDGEVCFPEGLSSAQRRALSGHLLGLRINEAQQVLDELAGQLTRGKIDKPVGYGVALIGRLKRGEFVPEAGVPIAELRAAERLQAQVLRAPWTTPVPPSNAHSNGVPPIARAALDRLRATLAYASRTRAPENAQANVSRPADDVE
jgi:hypothetical protein